MTYDFNPLDNVALGTGDCIVNVAVKQFLGHDVQNCPFPVIPQAVPKGGQNRFYVFPIFANSEK